MVHAPHVAGAAAGASGAGQGLRGGFLQGGILGASEEEDDEEEEDEDLDGGGESDSDDDGWAAEMEAELGS